MMKRSHTTVLDDLPEWIVIEEILVWLPPKDLFRCRAVCKLWRSATSTDKFMLDNCRRQPLLPVITQDIPGQEGVRFVVFRDKSVGADQKLCPIIQHSKFHNLLGACDGFLILFSESDFWICNPATRKCAILPQPRVPSSSAGVPRIYIAGFYQHQPSGEYRVLWFSRGCLCGYVLRFGSDKPRIISRPSVSSRLPEFWHQGEFDSCYSSQVNHRGSLHWLTGIYMETAVDIMVFDTVTETFRWMRSPGRLGRRVSLLEMDNKLASCIDNDASIEIWVMQDYEAEVWALKYRINLLAMNTSPQFKYISKMALLNQRELLICCHTPSVGPDYLLHCDTDGKFLGYYEMKEGTYSTYFTNQYFQESMIPLPFCEMQEEGGVDKEPPFFIGL
ncbi:hypothetical protein CFC21_099526 [Triticum aestivum]|uniref:F-box domain-containing protein n=2 Tax=Triticum aestivum TaxID=4565 RepID=A0A3B6RPP0_WHEAT|nr:putative F-box protein At4g21240 [Triticum aestivum]XP_044428825.1 putative F-box protein At4g21240 [Triticum aestivum]KAF7097736.1 hypothetical protein CFC21_099526 [Triticum aestivum]